MVSDILAAMPKSAIDKKNILIEQDVLLGHYHEEGKVTISKISLPSLILPCTVNKMFAP